MKHLIDINRLQSTVTKIAYFNAFFGKRWFYLKISTLFRKFPDARKYFKHKLFIPFTRHMQSCRVRSHRKRVTKTNWNSFISWDVKRLRGIKYDCFAISEICFDIEIRKILKEHCFRAHRYSKKAEGVNFWVAHLWNAVSVYGRGFLHFKIKVDEKIHFYWKTCVLKNSLLLRKTHVQVQYMSTK